MVSCGMRTRCADAHYAISTFFIRRGIHVYCQKPLCHTMWETREIAKEAREHNVVTQMGNQGHSSVSSSNIYEWVREGAIGKVREVGRPSGSSYRNEGKGHFENFTLACKGTGKAMSNFDYAGPLSEINVLGDIALMHPNRTLEWDAENMRITNDEEANNSIFMRHEEPRDHMAWV